MNLCRFRSLALALGTAVVLAGCAADDEEILSAPAGAGGELFDRYVSLGNSITAGFQSAGIVDSTQVQAYPVLLARDIAGARFNVPALAQPGCPPPLRDPFSGQRTSNVPCALRRTPEAGPIQNLAVPGAKIVDAFNNLLPQSSANTLTTFILGGRTQVRAMLDARPTLVSAWLGNNDALGAALAGNLATLSPLAEFQGSLGTLVDSIATTPAAANDAVILIGVTDPQFAPALQPGAYFYAAAQQTGGRFLGRQVLPNCSPLIPADAQGSTFRINPLSRSLVSFTLFATDTVPVISCAPDAPFVLSVDEQQTVSARVTAFNTAIAAAATAQGWIYVDPNLVLAPLLAERREGVFFNRVRSCQALDVFLAQTGTFPASALPPLQQQLTQAIGVSCPVTGATAAPNFFGSLISFDGVHPSGEAHRIIANALALQLNQKFNLNLPQLTVPAIR